MRIFIASNISESLSTWWPVTYRALSSILPFTPPSFLWEKCFRPEGKRMKNGYADIWDRRSPLPLAPSPWAPIFHWPCRILVSESLLQNKEGTTEGESLVIEFWQLIAQDYSMVHASSCNSDQVDDTPTGPIPTHGQSDSCRGRELERGRENGLTPKILSFPFCLYAYYHLKTSKPIS